MAGARRYSWEAKGVGRGDIIDYLLFIVDLYFLHLMTCWCLTWTACWTCFVWFACWTTHSDPIVYDRTRTRIQWCLIMKTRGVRLGSKVGQIGPKWDKSRTFRDQISVHEPKCTDIWSEEVLDLPHFCGQSDPLLSQTCFPCTKMRKLCRHDDGRENWASTNRFVIRISLID